ncbi:hypothetical protein AB0J71_46490 [Nonomuraea sp. NPDC049637]|uniref:hypothetical protein n=1 Tax=Nonomuraea sp. NPDC049637 TaxID=3154356 RepID=UPI003420C773
MAVSRSRQMRDLARTLSTVIAGDVEAVFAGPGWDFRWCDGPASSTMRALVREHASVGLDCGAIGLDRSISAEAFAVQAVRLAIAGDLSFSGQEYLAGRMDWIIRDACQHLDHPDRAEDDQVATMAAQLIQVAGRDSYRVSDLLVQHGGVSWLLPEPSPAEVAACPRVALQLLTARYASGVAAQQWRQRLTTLQDDAALAAARADPAADAIVDVAVLALAAERRERVLAELDAERLADLDRARGRTPAVSWSLIGRALRGITWQAAQQQHDRLRAQTERRRVIR